MALDGEVCEMDVSRLNSMSRVSCHCCWMECETVGKDMGIALANLPCKASLRAHALDAELARGRRRKRG